MTNDVPMWALICMPLIAALCGSTVDQTLPEGGNVAFALLLPVFTGPIWLALVDLRINPQILRRSTINKGPLVIAAWVFAPAYVSLRQRAVGQPRWPAAAYFPVLLLVSALS